MQGDAIATMGELDSHWTAAKSENAAQTAISRTQALGELEEKERDKREQSLAVADDTCGGRGE